MNWPKATDYNEAVQDLRRTAGDEELRGGGVVRNALGLPLLWSGNFADVYKIHCPATGNTWALKCFTRQVHGLQERYRHIAAHLEGARLPFTVGFQYLDQGLRIGDRWYPALKMRWVDGLTLSQYIEEHLDRPANLKLLLAPWLRMAAMLRQAGVAHADLQHGNVLLVPQGQGALALRLIDYDGMYVPALAGTRSGELGHPAYQHPQRLREGSYNPEVDRFPHLAIYTAIHCLALGRRELWSRFHNGDNLLFREADFRDPGSSDAFRALWDLRDADAQALIGRLMLACQQPLSRTPLLEELVSEGEIQPLSFGEELAIDRMLAEKPVRGRKRAASSPLPRPANENAEPEDAVFQAVLDEVVPESAIATAPAWQQGTIPAEAAAPTADAGSRPLPLATSVPEPWEPSGEGLGDAAQEIWIRIVSGIATVLYLPLRPFEPLVRRPHIIVESMLALVFFALLWLSAIGLSKVGSAVDKFVRDPLSERKPATAPPTPTPPQSPVPALPPSSWLGKQAEDLTRAPRSDGSASGPSQGAPTYPTSTFGPRPGNPRP